MSDGLPHSLRRSFPVASIGGDMGQEHKIEGPPSGVLGVLGHAQRLRQQVFRLATIAPKGQFVSCEVLQQRPS